MERIFEGLWTWSVFSEEKKIDFNGFLLSDSEGTVLIDPPRMDAAGRDHLAALRGPYHIVLTNKDHLRESPRFKEELGARLWIHASDGPLLGIAADATYRGGDRLPGGLEAIHVPEGKSPGETALYLERHGGVLLVGDALIGDPPGSLRLLPDAKYADPAAARRGLRVLLEPAYGTLLVGDGKPILANAHDAVRRFLEGDPSGSSGVGS